MVNEDGRELSGIAYLEWLKDNFPADNAPLLDVPLDSKPQQKDKTRRVPIVFGLADFYGPRACTCGVGIEQNAGHKIWCVMGDKKNAISDQQSN